MVRVECPAPIQGVDKLAQHVPKTFAEKWAFLLEVGKAYLKGEISWESRQGYEKLYGELPTEIDNGNTQP